MKFSQLAKWKHSAVW